MALPPSSTGFKIDLSPLLKTGLQLNKFDKGIPFWAEADGLQFTQNSVQRKLGKTLIVDLGTEAIRGATAINDFSTKVAYIGDLSNLYSYRLDTAATETVGSGYTLIENGGATEWDSGSTTWDSGATVWDEGTIEPDQWSFTTFGKFIVAADGNSALKVKKSHLTFNDLFEDEVSGVTITSGGSGHAVGDTITFTGGSGTGFEIEVFEETAGVVERVKVTNYGANYVDGDSLTQNTTTGIGTGLTLDVIVPDAPFTRADIVATLGPHVLVFNYDTAGGEFPTSFAWCSEDDIDLWTPASTNSAGDLQIREARTQIRSVVPLGNNLAVYTENALFLVSYTGAPFYFGYRPVMTSGVGAISIRSVIPVEKLNYGISDQGIFVTDGVTVTKLGIEEGIWDYVNGNISETEKTKVTGYHNPRDQEVVWFLPNNSTSITEELYYNYEIGVFGLRSTNVTSALEKGVFRDAITGDADGKIYFEDEGIEVQTTTGTTRAHDLDDPDRVKELTSIRVGKRGNGSPTIQVGWADDINGTPTFVDSFTVDNTFDEHFLRTAGRYLFLKVSSSSASDTWEITHMEVQGRLGGTR